MSYTPWRFFQPIRASCSSVSGSVASTWSRTCITRRLMSGIPTFAVPLPNTTRGARTLPFGVVTNTVLPSSVTVTSGVCS